MAHCLRWKTYLGAWLGVVLVGPGSAWGARDTEVAPFLHGEVSAGFQGTSLWGRLTEDNVPVGNFSEGQTGLQGSIRLGVLPGLEVFGTLPQIIRGHRRYSSVASMCGDAANLAAGTVVYPDPETPCTLNSTIYPNPEEGEYSPNPAADSVPEYRISGLGDTVIGVRLSPIHEQSLGSLKTGRRLLPAVFPALATWRIDLGIIMNTGGNFYAGGPGNGTTGLLLGTSFSKKIGGSEPYFAVTQSRFSPYSLPVEGNTTILEVQSPNETDLLFGVEVVPYLDTRSGARFAVDFAGGAHIWSEGRVVSGSVLPSVVTTTDDVDGTNGEGVTQESRLAFQARLRLHYQIFRYLRIQGGGRLQYILPHRPEAPYQLVLGRNLQTGFETEMAITF